MLVFSGHLISLMERLSKEISWTVVKNSVLMRIMARMEAVANYVYQEATMRVVKHANWLTTIQVFLFP